MLIDVAEVLVYLKILSPVPSVLVKLQNGVDTKNPLSNPTAQVLPDLFPRLETIASGFSLMLEEAVQVSKALPSTLYFPELPPRVTAFLSSGAGVRGHSFTGTTN